MEQTGFVAMLVNLAPILFFVLLLYLLIIRPQNSRRKKHQEMVSKLAKGDKIITTGGFIVEIIKPEENFFQVRVDDNTTAKLSREFVAYKLEDEEAK